MMEQLCLLLQLRVFSLGLLQDGDVGVGIFPEGDKSSDWPSSLRQPHLAYQFSKARVGTQGVELEESLQTQQQAIALLICGVKPLEGLIFVSQVGVEHSNHESITTTRRS